MHYKVGVIIRPFESLDSVMAPFDENIDVEPYIEYTKAELIEKGKRIKERILSEAPAKRTDWEKQYVSAKTDEEIYRLVREDEWYTYDEYGNQISTYNPDAKWDWYEIGGRWADSLRFKDGTRGNFGKISEIDFSDDDEKYYQALHNYNNPYSVYPGGIREQYTAEEFARMQSKFHTGTVLIDGIWYEETASAEWIDSYYSNFIKDLNPDDEFYIVDCHI